MATEILSGKDHIQTTINGESVDFLTEPRESLLEVLRDSLGLTGAKEGCNNGNCGACNVIMDGRLVNACCVLGVEAAGSLETNPEPTDHEVRWWLAGNLWRCTGYDKIVRAVLDAAKTMRTEI